jgi:hypothetical protein
MDEAAKAGVAEFFVDILGINGVRKPKPDVLTSAETNPE